MPPEDEYLEFPRPQKTYYESRHEFLTQGDILVDVPWSQLGPELFLLAPAPEWLPLPAGAEPIATYVWTSGFGMILSDTCDFRHPKAQDIALHPDHFERPDSVYHSGFLRVAPIYPLATFPGLPDDQGLRERLRQYDHFRKLMYLPPLTLPNGSEVFAEALVVINQADLLHLDLVGRLERVTQLSLVGRQQLNRKLVYADTGFQIPFEKFSPDLD